MSTSRSADERLEPFHRSETPASCSKQVGGRWPRACDCGLDDAKQAMLVDLLSLPEMQDELIKPGYYDYKWEHRNQLRAELRKALTAYFMGGDVGVDNVSEVVK